MLRVDKSLCLGCGLCVESCHQYAISVVSDQAHINQSLCNQCLSCVEVCPQGAIVSLIPVSEQEFRDEVAMLKQISDNLVKRIDKLMQ